MTNKKKGFPGSFFGRSSSALEAGAFCVGFDGACDFEGQGQGCGGVCGRDDGGLASADGVEEGFDLKAKGFAFGDFDVAEAEARGGVGWLRIWACNGIHPTHAVRLHGWGTQ
jgi:hypothetical protein